MGRSTGSCIDSLGLCGTSGVGSNSEGKGTLDLTGVLSTELGASGLAMVNLPIAAGGSTDMKDLRSVDLRGAATFGAGFAELSSSNAGGGTRLRGSVLRESNDGFSCSECRVIAKERRELRSDGASPATLTCCQSSALPTEPVPILCTGRRIILSFFTILPSMLPRFSRFSLTICATAAGAELYVGCVDSDGGIVDIRLG